MKRGKLRQIHTHGDHHVNINTETRVMLLPQDKGHQRLPVNHQKLGKKSKEQTLATPWPQTSSLQTWETVHFSGLSHPFVVLCHGALETNIQPLRMSQWNGALVSHSRTSLITTFARGVTSIPVSASKLLHSPMDPKIKFPNKTSAPSPWLRLCFLMGIHRTRHLPLEGQPSA